MSNIKIIHEVIPVTQNVTRDKWKLVWSHANMKLFPRMESGSWEPEKRITTKEQVQMAKVKHTVAILKLLKKEIDAELKNAELALRTITE